MLRIPAVTSPLLPRPYAVLDYKVTRGQCRFSVLYRVVGRQTELLLRLRKGDRVEAIGPLGKGLARDTFAGCRGIDFVAGGVGLAGVFLGMKLFAAKSKRLFYGARSAEEIVLRSWIRKRGLRTFVSTDDGSLGFRGSVVDCYRRFCEKTGFDGRAVFACGPSAMLKAIAMFCLRRGIPCYLSLEERMACGMGLCLGCMVRLRGEGGEAGPLVTSCREGPVFRATDVDLEALL